MEHSCNNTIERIAKMTENLPVSIVVPIHNEEVILEENVLGMVHELTAISGLNWDILLIENGSTDRTLELAHQLSDEHEQVQYTTLSDANYGKALQHGFQKATGKIIVNFDIDYWDVEFVNIARYVMQVKYDIIIASKNLLISKDRRGLLRKTTSYGFRMILFFAFGLRVSDTHGIKAWRNTERMQSYFRESYPSHHTYDTEVIIRAMHDYCEILEIPAEVVEIRASDRHILKRVPQALRELFSIHQRMRGKNK